MTVGWSGGQTLTESWKRSAWSIVPSPDPSGSSQNELWGASCRRARHCIAVGYYNSGTVNQTLVESWNGGAWSIVPSLDPSGSGRHDISCGGVRRCMVLTGI
jgi:hypothetical protein